MEEGDVGQLAVELGTGFTGRGDAPMTDVVKGKDVNGMTIRTRMDRAAAIGEREAGGEGTTRSRPRLGRVCINARRPSRPGGS